MLKKGNKVKVLTGKDKRKEGEILMAGPAGEKHGNPPPKKVRKTFQ